MGVLLSIINESFPPKPQWTTENMADLSGKVMIMTGGNSGLGKEATKNLLAHNAKVYMASRNKSKAEAAIQELRKETGKEAIFLELDLADLDSVEKAAKIFLSKENRLDVLFNSGGVMVPPKDQLTVQGYDLQFGTGVVGHFYLTKLLLPILIATANLNADGKARIVSTTSGAHHLSGISLQTLKDGPARRKLGVKSLYAQSKFGVAVLSRELARRYGDKGIVSISVNPGNVKTGLHRHLKGMEWLFVRSMCYPLVPYGPLTQLWAGTAAETAEYNGEYVIPWGRVGKAKADSDNTAIREKLWGWLEEQIANRYGTTHF